MGFNKLGTTKAGNLPNYSFIYINPSGSIHYYRIIANELSGKKLMSAVVQVNSSITNAEKYNVYPNPIKNNLISFQTNNLY